MTELAANALLPVDLGRARGVFTTRFAPASAAGARSAAMDSGSQAAAEPFAQPCSHLGGHSAGRYASFNLAHHVGDDAGAVASARQALASSLGLAAGQIAWMNQVHSARAVLARPQRSWAEEPVADALVLDRRDPACVGLRAVAVLVADCVPLLLSSADGTVVAAVHAGRAGMLDGVVPATLELMAGRGVEIEQVSAVLGPCICGSCYEVSEQIAAEAARREPACRAVTAWGTPAVDVAAGVRTQLERAGVRDVVGPLACTREEERLYSYRRDGVTGRLAGVVILED